MFGERRARLLGGSVLAMACVVFGATPAAQGYEVKEAANGQPIHWESGSIVFQTDPSMESLVSGATAVVGEAVGPWSSVEGGPGISVQPAAGPSQPEYDSRNVIYFYPYGYDLAGSALAITIVTYDDTTASILDTDVVLNGRYSFAALPAGAMPAPWAAPVANDGASTEGGGQFSRAALGAFDLVHVVAHETGHALGLRDETTAEGPVMYVYTLPGDASRRVPTLDDLDGIKEIYAGVAATRQGCSSSTVSPRRPRVAPLSVVGTVLVMALGWAFARWRRTRIRGPLALAGALATAIVGPANAHRGARLGDATARVVAVRDMETEGPWRTEVTLSPIHCRVAACPASVTLAHWGGRRGRLVQQVGEFVPPRIGDEVEIVADEGRDGASRFRILEQN